ncbi:MAG: DNA-binding response regulator [Bacteroidetes bacterium HGW-Bacteroidetes-6]|nr:MAG: DNA-binding response regulator [Bacteroidetes bacterium HGW-Bacteroidetes-6]
MKILIAEDEPKTALLLSKLILSVEKNARIVAVCSTVAETVEFLRNSGQHPDLCFFDIQLADGLSTSVFRQTDVKCPVIFCTAYSEYTIEAFKSNGIAYVLKPFGEKDISEALLAYKRLDQHFSENMRRIGQLDNELKSPKEISLKTFIIERRNEMIPLDSASVMLVVLENEILKLYDEKGVQHNYFASLDELEKQLDPFLFFRINRQMLVNRKSLVSMERYFGRRLRLKLNPIADVEVFVSRSRVSDFMNWLSG